MEQAEHALPSAELGERAGGIERGRHYLENVRQVAVVEAVWVKVSEEVGGREEILGAWVWNRGDPDAVWRPAVRSE